MISASKIEAASDYSRNETLLHGRVSGEPTVKEMPSGDTVVEFRIVVRRDGRNGVDTLDIAAWSGRSRRTALSLRDGEWVEVIGAIHRRFWQGAQGLASCWQVEASELRRI